MRILFLIGCVSIFFSCQPEFLPPDFPAAGSFSDSSGNCYGSMVEGSYLEGTPLSSSHFIDAFANFTTAGTYDIRTDTLNGYFFVARGTVSSPGLNTIRLLGYGQPLVAGSDTFQMRLNQSACDVVVEVLSSSTPPAVLTFAGNGGACSGAVLAGTYNSGAPMTSSNTVTLDVAVVSPGPYNITTNSDNGVSFSSSGTATSTTTSITFIATGTPTVSTTDVTGDYSVTFGASTCNFNVVFTGTPAGPASFTFDCGTMDGTFPVNGDLLRVGQVLNPAVDTITVEVDVINTGTYSITTAYGLGGPDGVNFNTSGVFVTTGLQTLKLGANGTAGRGGFVFYNLSSPEATNTTFCSTGAYYEFLYCNGASGPSSNFAFQSSALNDNSSLAGYDLVRLKGFSSATGSENVELTIGLPTGGDFGTVSGPDVVYSTNGFPAKYVKAVYTDPASPGTIYTAETDGTTQPDPFTITIEFCTSIRIEGFYSGVVKEVGGTGTKTISGRFGLRRN